jgi:hypothetical protein
VADALGLFTGEVASLTAYADDGSAQRVFALSIQKPDDLMRVLRTTLSSLIVADDASGGVRYLDLSYPIKDPATGEQRRNFYYVAVTPTTVFVAPRKSLLREAMRRSENSGAGSQSLLANPEFARLRPELPEKLSGFAGADLSHLPWDKMLANFAAQMAAAAKQSKDPNNPPPNLDWLKQLKPGVFSRHLHVSVSGWWKDSNGVYFDSLMD